MQTEESYNEDEIGKCSTFYIRRCGFNEYQIVGFKRTKDGMDGVCVKKASTREELDAFAKENGIKLYERMDVSEFFGRHRFRAVLPAKCCLSCKHGDWPGGGHKGESFWCNNPCIHCPDGERFGHGVGHDPSNTVCDAWEGKDKEG